MLDTRTDAEIVLHNEQEVRQCLSEIAESSIILGKPSILIDRAIQWLLAWNTSHGEICFEAGRKHERDLMKKFSQEIEP